MANRQWLALLKGTQGNPQNAEITLELESAAEAEAIQAAFMKSGAEGQAPSDQLMYRPVRCCPVVDPFGLQIMIVASLNQEHMAGSQPSGDHWIPRLDSDAIVRKISGDGNHLGTPLYEFLRLCDASLLANEVLDCGAGGSNPPLSLFYQHGYKTYSIEIAKEALEEAQRFCAEHDMALNIIGADMCSIPFPKEAFGFVYTYNAIDFMTKPDIARKS